jgi:electron transport complex protein RnfD
MPSSPPYVHTAGSITRDMLLVVAALVPAIAVQAWSFGWGVVINIAVAAVVALAAEALMLRLRGRPVVVFLRDGSALVTALLLAVCLPPLVPWWLPAVGAAFAIIMAKHLYGGLGNNVFNPAMVGYVVLLIAFPPEMTTWLPPMVLRDIHLGFAEQLQFAFAGQLPTGLAIDAITMATPLDHLQNSLSAGGTVTEIMAQPVFGNYGGPGWGMVNIMLLLGGLALLATRVITWHVPVGLLGALGVMAGLFHGLEPDRFAGPGFHLLGPARSLLHRHRSRERRGIGPRPAGVRRRRRCAGMDHPHLRQLCRRDGLRRAADEHRRPHHRPLRPPQGLRPSGGMKG